ncbi:MAG: hypothetical protein ACRERU_16315 [Methylococcales bacterium]
MERHDIRVIVFCPRSSRYKLPNCLQESKFGTVIEVHGSKGDQKSIAAEFADLFDPPLLPGLEDQIEANKLRAYFLADQRPPRPFDWHVQALTASSDLIRGLKNSAAASFLLNCSEYNRKPFVPISNSCLAKNYPLRLRYPSSKQRFFARSHPPELLAWMGSFCRRYGARVDRILNAEYANYSGAATENLEGAGLRIQSRRIDGKQQIREQAGPLALAGCLRAIDLGTIKPGESALVAITGGWSGNGDGGVRPGLDNRGQLHNQAIEFPWQDVGIHSRNQGGSSCLKRANNKVSAKSNREKNLSGS